MEWSSKWMPIGTPISTIHDSIFRCAPPQAVVLHRKPTSLPYAWSISEFLFGWGLGVVGGKKSTRWVSGFDMFFCSASSEGCILESLFAFRRFLDWTLENGCSVLFDCGLWTRDCFLDWGKGSEFVVASYHTHRIHVWYIYLHFPSSTKCT